MKFLSLTVMLAVWMLGNISYASQTDLGTFRILVTANSQSGELCVRPPCSDDLDAEGLADKLAEQVVLMLYRFEAPGASIAHQYERKGNAFLWKKPGDVKQVCDQNNYDAVLSINLDGLDDSPATSGKRDLFLRWLDCSSLETWNESIAVTNEKGWDVRQKVYKYLDVVFPYFYRQ